MMVVLAACVAEEDAPGPALPVLPPADEDTCLANDYAALIGAQIAAVTLPADLNERVIAPDSAVTMDFNPTRLNIHTDEAGVITRLSCG